MTKLDILRISNGNVTYLHKDHLGSASAGTDVNGTVAWVEQYTPFGETILNPAANDTSEAVEREFKFLIRGIKNSCRRAGRADGFTGHIKDKATGLQPLPGPFTPIFDIQYQIFRLCRTGSKACRRGIMIH